MGKLPAPAGGGGSITVILLLSLWLTFGLAQEYGCPPQDKILPCRCSTRDMEFQIWCSHSELPRVLEGLKAVSRHVSHPVDELILENNNLPSLPGHVFASLRVLRLMLRNNRLERVSSGWLEGLQDSLLELFLVEPDLRSLPVDSLENLQGMEAVTLQSKVMKRLPSFTGLSKLRYLQINSPSLIELTPRNFRDLPSLEQFHVFGSPKLGRLEAAFLRDLPRLQLVNISDCGIHWLHPRTFINLPELREIALVGNEIQDAMMVGKALVDLPALSVLQLDKNKILRLGEGSFVDLPMITRISVSNNRITEIFPSAFQRVPLLRTLNLNHNRIHRIHPDFFPQRNRDGNGLEEIWLMDNDIGHVSEIRSILEALPRLKFLEASYNQIQEIPFGSLRGHSSLERLHLDYNRLSFLQRDVFIDMPALRELRLRNNSLTNAPDTPFWNLPALKGLDISGNFFRHIEPRLLTNLPSLRRLDISENTVALVEPDAFLNTPGLEHINMSGNSLSVLHPMTFRHLTNLYELDLGWNRLLEIIPGLPRNIEHLHLPMNRIIALPPTRDSDSLVLPQLRSLDLSANGIEHIQAGTLIGLPNLRRLNLGFNALTIIEEGGFDGLDRLEQLDLKYNRIGLLQARCFRPLRNLLDLSLRGNRLEMIRPDVFEDNGRLQRLDISRNNLAQIPHATFAFTRELRELYASYNGLAELPNSLHNLEALQILDLSFNQLTNLSPATLSSLTNLIELRLVRNRVRELLEGAFDRLPRLALIDLESNDLSLVERSAVRSLPELQAIRLGKNRIQVIPSGAFSELPMLQSVELQENRIQEIAENAFINVPHLLVLNLSQNLLTSLEHMGLESLRSLEVLDLSENRITRVSSKSLAAMEWLVELKMDNNKICTIQGSPFDDMPRLRVLSLRSNRMASVSESAFKRLRSNIAVLDIDGNPLSCSCGMLWLRGWLQQASSEGPRCADGSLFKEIRLSQQDCQRERRLEPVFPGCENEALGTNPGSITPYVQNTEPQASWNKNTPSRVPGQDANYLYDDYDEDSETETSADLTNAINGTLSTALAPAPMLTQSAPPMSNEAPKDPSSSNIKSNSGHNNSNKINGSIKKNPVIPPSPSSSGFTFFGVPLPNLSFNLWGNSGKKSERKDDGIAISSSSQSSSSSYLRPGRGRYRNFPPTEPEIHRGGFVPMPRGHSGFVPITNPRLEQQDNNGSNHNTDQETIGQLVHERQSIKFSNYSVGKIERTVPLVNHTTSRHSNHSHIADPAKSNNTLKLPTTLAQQKQYYRTSTLRTTTITEDENERPTESYEFDEESGSSRVTWNISEPKNQVMKGATKGTVSAVVEVMDSESKNHDANNVFNKTYEELNIERDTTMINSMVTSEPEPEIITTDIIHTIQDIAMDQSLYRVTPRNQQQPIVTQQISRNMEASALSALLAPNGQVPSVPLVYSNTRPLGRPTITKVASPYLDNNGDKIQEQVEQLLAKEDSHLSGSSVDETVKAVENADFNWYFQHYNDTDLEPFVGVVYGNTVPSKAAEINLAVGLLVTSFMRFIL
ncbi:hypothetical protein TKK_0007300 [Trichogramma kaykai]|uniref:LRRCT domain-containing protein n=1 Tax=Trichogramma kaykai TaxID=54128 RepID=A0ABD2X9Z0_9HYME